MPENLSPQLYVQKRNGSTEPVDFNKILKAITRCAKGLENVDPHRVAVKTISQIQNGISTKQLDKESIKTAASLIPENQNYSKLAANILNEYIRKEVESQDILTFTQSIETLKKLDLVSDELYNLVLENSHKLNIAIRLECDSLFEYYALKEFFENRLIKSNGLIVETPQYFFLRKALENTNKIKEAISLYRKLAIGETNLTSLQKVSIENQIKQLDNEIIVRPVSPGMGQAVAERTFLRKKSDGSWEDWGDVADRVAAGNASLVSTPNYPSEIEEMKLKWHIAKGNTLMSGRHLQHGDRDQPKRNMEVFTNCFRGDTKVGTLEYGCVSLKDIEGKEVTVRAKDGQWRKAFCSAHGVQKLQKVTFGTNSQKLKYSPTEVYVTKDHRWFLLDGTETTNLKIGDKLGFAPIIEEKDQEAILHGLIFGDGSSHKSRKDYNIDYVSQGRDYVDIRLCGADKKYLDLFEGKYTITYPRTAHGDPVVYLGKKPFWKELPFTKDPSYISGFIHGWWLADGSKTYTRGPGSISISTANEEATNWIIDYAGYAGYFVVAVSKKERKENDGSFKNGKPLYEIRLAKITEAPRQVTNIIEDEEDEVYCLEEPVTHGFVLGNGILTGNCATSPASFITFYLLLNGSGVGRCYDDDMILVDWDNAPNLRCVIDSTHKDFNFNSHESLRDAKHKYGFGPDVIWHEVSDSREGWAKALELWEVLTFEKIHEHKLLILDFSKVRCSGSPIGGMQNRPASGPEPLMIAFQKAASLKGAGLAPWKQAMYIDHYFAECVLVGGARRAARMSTKYWKDPTIFDFITVKRPIEYYGCSVTEIQELRKEGQKLGFLWSSNNSIGVDFEFWECLNTKNENKTELEKHAKKVFDLTCQAAYGDGTGEPGFINVDKLVQKDDGWADLNRGDFIESAKFKLEDDTQLFLSKLAKRAKKKKFHMITNPCIAGDSIVKTNVGDIRIDDLVPRYLSGESFWVKDENDNFRAVIAAGLTRKNAEVIELTIEENKIIHKLVCTPDHKILTRNRGWIMAKDLDETDDIVVN